MKKPKLKKHFLSLFDKGGRGGISKPALTLCTLMPFPHTPKACCCFLAGILFHNFWSKERLRTISKPALTLLITLTFCFNIAFVPVGYAESGEETKPEVTYPPVPILSIVYDESNKPSYVFFPPGEHWRRDDVSTGEPPQYNTAPGFFEIDLIGKKIKFPVNFVSIGENGRLKTATTHFETVEKIMPLIVTKISKWLEQLKKGNFRLFKNKDKGNCLGFNPADPLDILCYTILQRYYNLVRNKENKKMYKNLVSANPEFMVNLYETLGFMRDETTSYTEKLGQQQKHLTEIGESFKQVANTARKFITFPATPFEINPVMNTTAAEIDEVIHTLKKKLAKNKNKLGNDVGNNLEPDQVDSVKTLGEIEKIKKEIEILELIKNRLKSSHFAPQFSAENQNLTNSINSKADIPSIINIFPPTRDTAAAIVANPFLALSVGLMAIRKETEKLSASQKCDANNQAFFAASGTISIGLFMVFPPAGLLAHGAFNLGKYLLGLVF